MTWWVARRLGSFVRVALLAAMLAAPSLAAALTVAEVANELACPCECPLILQDCNMTCGLEWKEQIGEMIRKGMTKQQIVDDFIARYGDEARITPWQRVNGKVYQYTRGFDTADWVLLWSALAVWVVLMFAAVYLGVKRLLAGKLQDA